MNLFRKKNAPPPAPRSSLAEYEPVLRSSICTGELTACMRNRETGKLHEIMVIRGQKDLEEFGKTYGVETETLRTVY